MSTSYDYESRHRAGIRVRVKCFGPSLTVQSHKDETDINKIVARFKRTGEMPLGNQNGQYADISTIQQLDPTSAINLSRETLQKVKEDVTEFQKKQREQKLKNEREKIREEVKQELLQQQEAPAKTA